MIQIEHVTKVFGKTMAVDDLTMEVNDSELCVLVGPSGSGKTTLLRMVNRMVEPTSGRIFINGQDTSEVEAEKLRQSIGYVIQSVGLFPHMNVSGNIAVVPELLHWDKKRVQLRICELLELVGLDAREYAGKYPGELSGGEAQRVGVARALAADPPVMLMDEPFGAVDPLTRQRLQGEFALIHRKLRKTVILVTHDLDEAIRLADRIAIMRSGKLVQYETPEAILSKPANKFVHDFIGTDRALKRLSRMTLDGLVKPSLSVSITDTVEEAFSVIGDQVSCWVLDGEGVLIGWVSRNNLAQSASIGDALVAPDIEDISIMKSGTLRDALSKMLGQGVGTIPVIDDKGRLTGELSFREIEQAITGPEEKRV